jgi:hypothetical protein
MEQGKRISHSRIALFYDLMYLRNKAIHSPAHISEEDFTTAVKKLDRLEEGAP